MHGRAGGHQRCRALQPETDMPLAWKASDNKWALRFCVSAAFKPCCPQRRPIVVRHVAKQKAAAQRAATSRATGLLQRLRGDVGDGLQLLEQV
jgi:hypothetical protein